MIILITYYNIFLIYYLSYRNENTQKYFQDNFLNIIYFNLRNKIQIILKSDAFLNV